MSESEGLLNKHQLKKAARKQRQQSERQAHRNLDDVTGQAIELAFQLAPTVAAATSLEDRDQPIDVELASESEAQFIRKRINDALKVDEWLDEVRIWVWKASEHNRAALTDQGRSKGFELRIDKAPKHVTP